MVANLLLACAGACLSVASSTAEEPVEAGGSLLLSCRGTLTAAGQQAGSPIITDGAVDLDHHWVYGFGLGGVPIVHMGRTDITFVSDQVEGTLDRQTGRTVISVRAASNPLMSMDLICRESPPLS